MLETSKFLHDSSVLHSMMMDSVCVRLGRPELYQQGCDRAVSNGFHAEMRKEWRKGCKQEREGLRPTHTSHRPA